MPLPPRLDSSWLAVALLTLGSAPALAGSSAVAAGRLLYMEGIGRDGKPVAALVQGDVAASANLLACVGCHRRSGFGASEGGARALSIAAPALFQKADPNSSSQTRRKTPYTDRTLARAISSGMDADGRILDPLMPRYGLTPADQRALTAYLRTLGTGSLPGVGPTEIRLATIVAESAPVRDREAVETVLQRFRDIKNGGTRQEQRRVEASRRHPYGERHVRAYRHWNLSVWTLRGPSSGWSRQLEARYREGAPFAVLSGAVGDDWAVVHEFCERHELPCVLPVTSLPVETGPGHYTIYISAGVRLDARVTARSILDGFQDPEARILLLHVDDARGRAARDALVEAWPPARRDDLTIHPVAPGAAPSFNDWKQVIHRERPDVLIAWLPPVQFQALTSIASSITTLPRRIYTAENFTDWRVVRALPMFEQRVLHVYPYSLAGPGLAQFPREQAWLKSQGLAGLETVPAVEALFACHAVGEAMADMADNYSREYLIETLEHMLDGTGMTTAFPVTSLGPGQRFLAKGAYVVRLMPDTGLARYVNAGWIQP